MSNFSEAYLTFPKNATFELALFPSNAYIEFFPEKKGSGSKKNGY